MPTRIVPRSTVVVVPFVASMFAPVTACLFALLIASSVNALAGDLDSAHTCDAGKRALAARAALIDDATGRDRRNHPPDRLVDYLHMKLQMRFDDLNARRFSAVETLTITPLGKPTASLTLDAVNLKFKSVTLADHKVEQSYDDRVLTLRFDPPLALDAKYDLIMDYECDRPVDGLFFTPTAPASPASPASPDVPEYSAEVHTQGESDTNRHWFACHDFPNDQMSTELIVDVPAGFQVSSNGRLVSNLTSGDRAVWHWSQEKPHVAYLVSLVIGKFDVVEIPHPRVPMKVWVPVGRGGDVPRSYGRTGEMIDLFEKRFGVPYPWERYDQILAKNFNAGGMENTTATTMYPTAVYDKTALLDGDLESLIAHELCHQWTGDYITCKSWAHIWLNEGWASYGSDLWFEQRDGVDGYLENIRDEFSVARGDRTDDNRIAMVSNEYDDPDDVFGRVANPYPKGASILHMLRMMMGDEVFWKGVRLYFQKCGPGLAETNDFRYAMEEASGLGLEWFFDQWCYRPGTPALKVNSIYDGATRMLTLDVEQSQKIDEATPAFRFTLPVLIRTTTGEMKHDIQVDSETTTYSVVLDGPPTMVAIDPQLHVLKTMTEDKPPAWWIEQLSNPPSIVAKHQAIEALGGSDSAENIALLTEIIRDDRQRPGIRNSAVESLAKFGSPEAKQAMLELAKAGVPEAKVRVTLVSQLRNLDKAQAAEGLLKFAQEDVSYAVRASAIDGLAALKCKEQADAVVALVEYPSHNDQVRNAALRALADFDDARALQLAMKYAAYGYMDRSRPTAISVVGRLAKHDQSKAVEFLIALLDDPEQRAVNAAGAALAETGDRKAEPRLRQMMENSPDPELRVRAKGWVETLRNKKQN